MSEKTQLTRINVPAITDARYIEGMSDAFDKINDNFKKIASLPFLQGVQGDSYQLEEYKIWNNWTITEDGKVLLDSIFGRDVTIDINGNIKNTFDEIRTNIGEDLAGTSPIDFFKNGNDIVNNSLYFYVIKDDTGNVIEKQLGQYYYFIDGRLKEIGNVYSDGVSLNGFNDYTGFYQYKYDSENNSKYVKVEILPTIYYDQNKNDICWKFNGNETGISAIGVKGADGKDADLLIVRATANENDCTGIVNAIINPIGGNTAEDQWIENPKDFKVGKALICIQNEKGDAQDFAYGQVIQSSGVFNAYWEPNYNFSKLIGNNRITNYFYNMGEDDTETSPFYLAIPSSYNRGASGTTTDKQKAHVIKGSSETSEDLNIFYSEDAFGENGEQNRDVTSSTTITKNLNIQNYNTTISKKLTVSGSAEVSGGLTVKNGGAVISSGGIQVTTQKPKTMTGNATVENINSNVLIGHNNPGNDGCKDFPNDITKGGYPLVTMSYNTDGSESKNCLVFGNGDIYALNWNGTKYEPGTLRLQDRTGYFGKTKVGGSFEVGGTSLLKGAVTLGSSASLTVGGSATFSDTATFNKPVTLGSSASLTVGGSATFSKAATFNDTATFNKLVTLGSSASLTVGGSATFNNPVTINSTLGVTDTATFGNPVTMDSSLKVSGIATFNSSSYLNGLVRVRNDQNSSSTGTGALVVSGGAGIAKNLYVGSSTNISGKITGGSGIKIYGGTSEFYSGTGTEDNSNYLKVDSNGVFVSGGAGKLVLNGTNRQLLIGSLASNNTFNAGININNTDDNTSTILFKGKNVNNSNYTNQMVITTNADTTNKYTVGRLYMDNNYDKQYIQIFAGHDKDKNNRINPIYANSKAGIQILHDGGNSASDCVTIKPKLIVDGTGNAANSVSTSKTTGALVVKGGVGITGAVNIGETAKIGSTQDSSSTTTGALVVTGGAGVQKQVHLGQYLSINNTYDSGKETSNNISDITDDVHPGQIYLGEPPSNKTTPINRMLINRHSIQAYTTYGTDGKYKSPDSSTLYINHKGGNVIVGKSGYKLDVKGTLTVAGQSTFNEKTTINNGNFEIGTVGKQIILPTKGVSWKDTNNLNNSSIHINGPSSSSTSFHSIIGINTKSNNIVNNGVVNDNFGFYGIKNGSDPASGPDWKFSIDTNTGNVNLTGNMNVHDISSNNISSNNISSNNISSNDISANDISANDISANDISANDIDCSKINCSGNINLNSIFIDDAIYTAQAVINKYWPSNSGENNNKSGKCYSKTSTSGISFAGLAGSFTSKNTTASISYPATTIKISNTVQCKGTYGLASQLYWYKIYGVKVELYLKSGNKTINLTSTNSTDLNFDEGCYATASQTKNRTQTLSVTLPAITNKSITLDKNTTYSIYIKLTYSETNFKYRNYIEGITISNSYTVENNNNWSVTQKLSEQNDVSTIVFRNGVVSGYNRGSIAGFYTADNTKGADTYLFATYFDSTAQTIKYKKKKITDIIGGSGYNL